MANLIKFDLNQNESPKNADVIFTSIDSGGTPGALNQYVLDELGLGQDALPIRKSLINGYSIYEGETTIIYVVTVGNGSTKDSLKENLEKACNEYLLKLNNKRIWIPLMGTGTGNLSFEDSYEISYEVLRKVGIKLPSAEFIFSIPNTEEGDSFIDKHGTPDRSSYQKEFDNVLQDLKINDQTGEQRSFYVAGHHWNKVDNKLPAFIRDGNWVNGHDEKFSKIVNGVKNGDVLFAKAAWAEKGQGHLTIRAAGLVTYNPRNGSELKVQWFEFSDEIVLNEGSQYRGAIHRISDRSLDPILKGIFDVYPDLPRVIENLTDDSQLPPESSDILKYIQEKLNEKANFWWINAATKWTIDQLNVGDIESYGAKGAAGRYQKYVKQLEIGDLLIGYQAKPDRSIVGLLRITKLPEKEERYYFELLYKFERRTSLKELKKLPLFSNSPLNGTLQGALHPVQPDVFQEIINTTELVEQDPIDEQRDLKESNQNRGASKQTTKDKIPFHNDVVAQEDKLGREPVAEAFVKLIKNDVFTEDMNHAFMVHLQGEWGAGKSTFLNLIKKHLNEGDEEWIIIDYNAWQNQHLLPPWWTFIDQIYRQANDQLRLCRLRLKEKLRRIIWYSGWQKGISLLFTIVFVLLIGIYGNSILDFLVNAPEANANINNVEKGITLGVFSKLFISFGSVIGLIYSFSKFIATPFFINSTEEATSFVQKSADPMSRIKSHFNNLVDDINSTKKKRQLAIFIDDIDRCNREFIIQLLEGIQTLFKEKRVLYIVAGDKDWIATSFENTYTEFNTVQSSSHGNLGELFLEKAFQLSIRMPDISSDAKEEYWSHILGIEEVVEEERVEVDEMTQDQKQEVQKDLNSTEEDIASPSFIKQFEQKHKLSSNAASSLIIEKKNESDKEIRHLLKDLHGMVETNPRSIIRLANNYTMTRSTLIAERKDINAEKLFRWLILKDLYPNALEDVKSGKSMTEFQKDLKKVVKENVAQSRCLKLLTGDKKKKNDSLTVDELRKFEGI